MRPKLKEECAIRAEYLDAVVVGVGDDHLVAERRVCDSLRTAKHPISTAAIWAADAKIKGAI